MLSEHCGRAQGGAEADERRAEWSDLISSDCPRCGGLLVETVSMSLEMPPGGPDFD
jgi:hypothetical protein